MVNRDDAIKIAQSFVNDCKFNGLSFNTVLLFGSTVKGITHDGSDIDLIIVSDKFKDNVFEDLKLYAKINIKYLIIETHPMSTKAFNENNPFVEQVKNESIRIC